MDTPPTSRIVPTFTAAAVRCVEHHPYCQALDTPHEFAIRGGKFRSHPPPNRVPPSPLVKSHLKSILGVRAGPPPFCAPETREIEPKPARFDILLTIFALSGITLCSVWLHDLPDCGALDEALVCSERSCWRPRLSRG